MLPTSPIVNDHVLMLDGGWDAPSDSSAAGAMVLDHRGECAGVIADRAMVRAGVALSDAWQHPGAAPWLAVWSGSMSDDPRSRERRNWGEDAWRAFAAAIESAADRASAAGSRVLIRPHARHIVSDGPRCARVAREFGERGVGLLLDPVSMLEGSMVRDAGDHVRRWMGELGPIARAVLASGVLAPVEGAEDELPRRAPLNEGVIGVSAWREALASLGARAPAVIVGKAHEAALLRE